MRQINESVGCGRWIEFARQESCLIRTINIQDDDLSGDLVGPMQVLDLLVQQEKTFEKMDLESERVREVFWRIIR